MFSLPVKTNDFLPQNSIHRLFILDWIFFHHILKVKILGKFGQDVLCKLLDDLLQSKQAQSD